MIPRRLRTPRTPHTVLEVDPAYRLPAELAERLSQEWLRGGRRGVAIVQGVTVRQLARGMRVRVK